VDDWGQVYLNYLQGLAGLPLAGLHLVLDCANGAASGFAPQLFRALGAAVEVINAEPDGLNINRGCGSTHLQDLMAAVLERNADLGLAFDGDADRLLAVDELGHPVDGDAIMAICAVHLQQAGRLKGNRLVATVMSNLGLQKAMERQGISLLRSQVGDRYVLAMMQEVDATLGGEQSGHIIFSEFGTTGDGLLTALQLTQVVAASRKSMAELAGMIERYPQVLQNVRVAEKTVLQQEEVQAAIRRAEQKLGSEGRILVRPSGTEPVIRVMAEAPSQDLAEAAVSIVVSTLQTLR
jgi:phosphoglucosamine mutase